MSWWKKSEPVDTSAAFDALDRADAAARTSSLQSRTLSRAIRCGDPIRFVEGIMADGHLRARVVLRAMFPPTDATDEMVGLLADIERGER